MAPHSYEAKCKEIEERHTLVIGLDAITEHNSEIMSHARSNSHERDSKRASFISIGNANAIKEINSNMSPA